MRTAYGVPQNRRRPVRKRVRVPVQTQTGSGHHGRDAADDDGQLNTLTAAIGKSELNNDNSFMPNVYNVPFLLFKLLLLLLYIFSYNIYES